MGFIKYVALGFIVFCIGFFGWNFYLGTLPNLLQDLGTQLQPLTNIGRAIYAKWTSLPQAIQSIILMGIPTLFAIFFAWTKTRAMQKLQETQIQASQTQTQITGELNSAQQQLATLQQEKIQLTQQLQSNPLSQSLDEAQQLVTQYRQEIATKNTQIETLQKEIATLSGQITGMKTQIEFKEYLK